MKKTKTRRMILTDIEWGTDASVFLPQALHIDLNKNNRALLKDLHGSADNLFNYLSSKYKYCPKSCVVDIIFI